MISGAVGTPGRAGTGEVEQFGFEPDDDGGGSIRKALAYIEIVNNGKMNLLESFILRRLCEWPRLAAAEFGGDAIFDFFMEPRDTRDFLGGGECDAVELDVRQAQRTHALAHSWKTRLSHAPARTLIRSPTQLPTPAQAFSRR
jgi:hypothetical protein